MARDIKEIFEKTQGVVDVDWYVEADQKKIIFDVDREKAAANKINSEAVSRNVRIAVGGVGAGLVHLDREREPVEIFLRMPLADRADPAILRSLYIPSPAEASVPLAELIKIRERMEDKTIYHKNLKNVTYVIGDVAGTEESPIYQL